MARQIDSNSAEQPSDPTPTQEYDLQFPSPSFSLFPERHEEHVYHSSPLRASGMHGSSVSASTVQIPPPGTDYGGLASMYCTQHSALTSPSFQETFQTLENYLGPRRSQHPLFSTHYSQLQHHTHFVDRRFHQSQQQHPIHTPQDHRNPSLCSLPSLAPAPASCTMTDSGQRHLAPAPMPSNSDLPHTRSGTSQDARNADGSNLTIGVVRGRHRPSTRPAEPDMTSTSNTDGEAAAKEQAAGTRQYAAFAGQFTTYQAARAYLDRHKWFAPKGDCTIPSMDVEKIGWVRRLYDAMTNMSNLRDRPSSNRLPAWNSNTYSEQAIEAACWELLEQTVVLHQQGYGILPGHSKRPVDRYLNCEDRLTHICRCLRDWKSICTDVMNEVEIPNIVHGPAERYKSCTNNKKINGGKSNYMREGRKIVGVTGRKGRQKTNTPKETSPNKSTAGRTRTMSAVARPLQQLELQRSAGPQQSVDIVQLPPPRNSNALHTPGESPTGPTARAPFALDLARMPLASRETAGNESEQPAAGSGVTASATTSTSVRGAEADASSRATATPGSRRTRAGRSSYASYFK